MQILQGIAPNIRTHVYVYIIIHIILWQLVISLSLMGLILIGDIRKQGVEGGGRPPRFLV